MKGKSRLELAAERIWSLSHKAIAGDDAALSVCITIAMGQRLPPSLRAVATPGETFGEPAQVHHLTDYRSAKEATGHADLQQKQ